MNRPSWITNEEHRLKARHCVVALCEDYLHGQTGLIETARKLLPYAYELRADNDPDFIVFRAIDSESDHLPVGQFREGWAKDALEKKDEEVRVFEESNRQIAAESAQNLIARYSH